MARPIKEGIDYFPLDVDFLQDIKVRKIMKAQSAAISVLIALLCNIYRDKGYYIGFGDDECFLIADEIGVSEGAVQEVVKMALKVGFFDQDKFNRYQILTSNGIQARYLEASNRRKMSTINPLYQVFDNNNGVHVNNNPVNDSKSTQRKGKERKEKERKEDDRDSITANINHQGSSMPKSSSIQDKLLVFLKDPALVCTVMAKIEESEWLKENIDLSKPFSSTFLKNILNDKYRTYRKVPEKASRAQSTDGYTAQELEAIAKQKRDAWRKK